MATFTAVAAALSMLSGAMQFASFRKAGKAAERAGRYAQTLAGRRAETLEQRAGQERAISQRAAIEQRRQGRFVSSRARTVGAASGASLASPSIQNVLAGIDEETELRALTALYEGEEAGRGLEYQAALERAGGAGEAYAGKVERSLANARANAALIGGLGQGSAILARDESLTRSPTLTEHGSSTLFTKYGMRASNRTFRTPASPGAYGYR